jgi:hypothetical protein
LMFATKVKYKIFMVAALVALVGAGFFGNIRPASPRLGRDIAIAAIACVLVAGAFYSSFGTHFGGLRDAVVAPFQALGRVGGASGHEKPFLYYVQLFTWQRGAGVVWQQLALCGLAIAGTVVALVRASLVEARSGETRVSTSDASTKPSARVGNTRLLRAVAVYTVFVGLVLSLTPYKTPWHAIHLVPGLCVLAAGALATIAALPAGRWVATLFAVFTCLMLGVQTRLAAFTYAADARNPLAYVHSSPDVTKVRASAVAALERSPGLPIRVIGDEYWPLPWYLRGLPQVGYWTTAPADCDGALVIVSPSAVDEVRGKLHRRYRESFFGLRPGVICLVFTREP